MRCDRVHEHLTGVAVGDVELEGDEAEHVRRCLRCQAEVSQHRRVARTLRSLASESIDPGPEFVEQVLLAVAAGSDRTGVRASLARHWVAYMAAATAAGATGALVVATRIRRTAVTVAG